jgi:hypothetical protein
MKLYGDFMGLYSDLMDYEWDIPSGKLTVCELENGHRNSGFSH